MGDPGEEGGVGDPGEEGGVGILGRRVWILGWGGGCLGGSKALSTLISVGQVTTPDDALLLGDHSNGLVIVLISWLVYSSGSVMRSPLVS